MAPSVTTVEKWVLDPTQYQAKLKEVAKSIRETKRVANDAALVQKTFGASMGEAGQKAETFRDRINDQFKSFTDYAQAVRGAIGVVKGLVRTFDSAMDRTGRLQGLQAGQTIGIEKAAQATGGLISKYKLLEAANRGVALGVDLNADKFAKLSKAAAIVAQRMGTDVNQAINDLMVGMGRQSRMILDNLGIIVRVDQANQDYAESLGKTVKQLTDAEKRIAFQTAALKELNRVAADGKLQTDSLANSYKRFKNILSDSFDEMTGGTAKVSTMSFAFQFWGDQVKRLVRWLKEANANIFGIGKAPILSSQDREFEDLIRKRGARFSRSEALPSLGVDEERERAADLATQKRLGLGEFTRGGKRRKGRGDKSGKGGGGRRGGWHFNTGQACCHWIDRRRNKRRQDCHH